MGFRLHSIFLLAFVFAAEGRAFEAAAPSAFDQLLGDPTPQEWKALSRFDRTLTRGDFDSRLDGIFDPGRGLRPYLRLTGDAVAVFPSPGHDGEPLAVVRFAPSPSSRAPLPASFRFPGQFRVRTGVLPGRPLEGLRVAIEPADIGGRWAKMEDRSFIFGGLSPINEGDLNLLVGRLLKEKLTQLGAVVFLVRTRPEPVVAARPEDLRGLAEDFLRNRPWRLPESYRYQTAGLPPGSPVRIRVAEELLLTKTVETRARADLVRRSFTPDITLVLQHNATAESREGRLTPINRNIFFVNGAFLPAEMREPEQRFHLLTKLLENTTAIEAPVAAAIAARFYEATGFPPVLSGDSGNTRLVLPGNRFVVARNLAFNREHDGPVVVTEPYFMNQAETLARLLAGDYPGKRPVDGRLRVSIYREYANCVAAGLVDSYGAVPAGGN